MNPSDDLVLRAFNQAPKIIQESLSEGKAVDFMESMLTRYNLHVDTVGYAMVFIRNMLLGLLQPDQFIGKLNSVGISTELARTITADLNKEVFVPLRDEMKRGGVGAFSQPTSIPHVPVMNIAAPEQTPEPIAPAPIPPTPVEPPPFNLIHTEPAPTPVSRAIPVPPPVPTPSPVSAPIAPIAPVPTMRTMQHDMDAVSHGAVPEPYPAALSTMPAAPQPSQMTPAREFQTASVPFTSMPIASRPSVPAPAPAAIPPFQPVSTPPISAPQPAVPSQPVPATDYSSDPYREAI